VSLLSKWKRVSNVLTERLGRPPTPEEVGKALRLSKKKVGIVAKAIQVNNLTPHPDGAESERSVLDDILTDDRCKAPEDQLIESDDLERILLRLDTLDEREATVVRMRFGLDPYSPLTLREVGENLGLTRERVRQLENSALLKLMDHLHDD
jgi:RNA polymerase primary sigma factor